MHTTETLSSQLVHFCKLQEITVYQTNCWTTYKPKKLFIFYKKIKVLFSFFINIDDTTIGFIVFYINLFFETSYTLFYKLVKKLYFQGRLK